MKLLKLKLPNQKESQKGIKTIEKGGKKGGTFNTTDKQKPKFKTQKFNLKHFWGQRRDHDGGLSESD